MPTLTQNSSQITIAKGKIVTVSFDACKHQKFKILDPNKSIVCTNKSIPESPFLFENQSFTASISGSHTIVITFNDKEQKVILNECNEIFGDSGVTKFYNFISKNAEISLVIHS